MLSMQMEHSELSPLAVTEACLPTVTDGTTGGALGAGTVKSPGCNHMIMMMM